MTTLLQLLQGMFSKGTIDFTGLDIPTLPPLLTGAGQPTTFSIASSSGWQTQGTTLVFTGTSTTTLFGVANPSIYMQFTPDDGNSYAFLLDVALPNSWTLSAGIPQFKGTLLDSLPLVPATSGPQPWAIVLASETSSDPQRQSSSKAIQVLPGVNLFAQFDAAVGPLAELSFLQQFTTPVMNISVWSFDDSSLKYAANPQFNFALVTITTTAILPSDDSLTLQLTLVCNVVAQALQAGIQFTAALNVGSTPVQLTALWLSASSNVLSLAVTGLTIPFPSPAQWAAIFGGGVDVGSVVPSTLTTSIQVSQLAFDISLTNKNLQDATIALSATASGSPFLIGPVSVPSVTLAVTYTSGSLGATLTTAGTISQQGDSLTISLTGTYKDSAYSFSSQVQGSPSIQTVVTALFGSAAPTNLPTSVLLTQLSMSMNLTTSKYTLGCTFSGNWAIPNTDVTFESLGIQVTNDPSLSGTITAQWAVGAGNEFNVDFQISSTNTEFTGSWTNNDNPITFVNIATALGMTDVPTLPPAFNFALQTASFQFDSSPTDLSLDFALTTASKNQAAMYAAKASSGSWGYVFGMNLGLSYTIQLSDIPVIGNLVPSGLNALEINNLRIVGATTAAVTPPASQSAIFGAEISAGLAVAVDLTIGTSGSQTVNFLLAPDSSGSGGASSQAVIKSPAERAIRADDSSSSGNTDAPQTGWLTVQRSFGPLSIDKVGFSLDSGTTTVSMFVDGSIQISALTMTFTGLEASMELQPVGTPEFSLDGLDISYNGAGLTIAGGLLITGHNPTEYSGSVLVKAANFTILGEGLYVDSTPPSLAGFFFVSAPLGGPAFFFVTGLAAGFGYNTSLQLPAITAVSTYPLIAGATGATGSKETQTNLAKVVSVEMNEDWLALGVAFTSFELLNSFALITVEFGTQLEIALIGMSTLSYPPANGDAGATPIAEVQLVLEAAFQPDLGQFALDAQLTPASYVFSKAAQLTGGFAYYQWFGSNEHAGDFVVTLGGYNPYWTPPAWYPTVPRLGLNWQISTELSVTGGLYFALTPSYIMAGGSLSAVWQSDGIKAWFDASADFLIRFQPFSYQINVNVSIGVTYSVKIIVMVSVTVHVGVGVQMWGPPFGGTASVDLSVISFTISFGASQTPPAAVTWTSFSSNFLPSPSGGGGGSSSKQAASRRKFLLKALADTGAPPPPPAPSPLINISAANGLIPNTVNYMQLDPLTFVLNITTQVPSTSATTNGTALSGSFAQLGVGPMGLKPGTVTSSLAITISQWENGKWSQDTQSWTVTPTTASVPGALWNNVSASLNDPDNVSLVPNALVGLTIVPGPFTPDQTLPVQISVLLVGPGPTIPVTLTGAPTTPWEGQYSTVWQEVQITIVTPLEIPQSAMLASLLAQGLSSLPSSVSLAGFAAEAPDLFTNPPVLAALGANQ